MQFTYFRDIEFPKTNSYGVEQAIFIAGKKLDSNDNYEVNLEKVVVGGDPYTKKDIEGYLITANFIGFPPANITTTFPAPSKVSSLTIVYSVLVKGKIEKFLQNFYNALEERSTEDWQTLKEIIKDPNNPSIKPKAEV
ncbi:hypothetical protein HN924_02680 [Candidatus Woesearchaeota archaeon]|jgi:hypothetical protein|nr:hypothetical protein [Candidatus Woesearchaeota archaeon]MBT7062847.1 hypothetical protein [Candidatus Woesearchaeota archaeon]MBT7403012.1 hypothetical protein [Candidatus Woesearchaeota archaeon]